MAVLFLSYTSASSTDEFPAISDMCISSEEFLNRNPPPIKQSSITSLIDLSAKAGNGSHGAVFIAQYYDQNAAFKVVEPLDWDKKSLTNNELQIYHDLRTMKEGILSIKDCVAEPNRIVMIFDAKGVGLMANNSPVLSFSHLKKYDIVIQIIKAIIELHKHDVYHGDLHGNNILYDPKTGKVTIIDMGLACRRNDRISIFNVIISPPEIWRTRILEENSMLPPLNDYCGDHIDVWQLLVLIGHIFMKNRSNPLEGTPLSCFSEEFVRACMASMHQNIKNEIGVIDSDLAKYLVESLRYTPSKRPSTAKDVLQSIEKIYENNLGAQRTNRPGSSIKPHKIFQELLVDNKNNQAVRADRASPSPEKQVIYLPIQVYSRKPKKGSPYLLQNSDKQIFSDMAGESSDNSVVPKNSKKKSEDVYRKVIRPDKPLPRMQKIEELPVESFDKENRNLLNKSPDGHGLKKETISREEMFAIKYGNLSPDIRNDKTSKRAENFPKRNKLPEVPRRVSRVPLKSVIIEESLRKIQKAVEKHSPRPLNHAINNISIKIGTPKAQSPLIIEELPVEILQKKKTEKHEEPLFNHLPEEQEIPLKRIGSRRPMGTMGMWKKMLEENKLKREGVAVN